MTHPRSNIIAVAGLSLCMLVSFVLVILNVGTFFRSVSLWIHSGGPVLGPATDPVTLTMHDTAISRGTLSWVFHEAGAKGRLPEGHTVTTGVPLPGTTWLFAEAFSPRPTEHNWGIAGHTYEFTNTGLGQSQGYQTYMRRVEFRLSLWPLTLVSVSLSLWMLRRYRDGRRRQRAEGRLCMECGYDLRATPERCPECGAVPEAVKGAAG